MKRGLIFLDIIIGLFIIGLIVVVSFPTLSLISKSFEKSKEMTELIYVAESTIESLKFRDEKSIKFLKDLEKTDDLEALFLEEENYISRVKLLNIHPDLWYLSISANKKDSEGGGAYVEIKVTIPK
ncbi:MAG: hypothetical protein ACTHW2_10180 [Tissierella sp.]|uniref:hypothetical protein n=1 Tax=Tissierella sp. TaxID=41274 RepID=UPI003F94A1F8